MRGAFAMKLCPECGSSYSDHIDYCFNDGETLDADSSTGATMSMTNLLDAPTVSMHDEPEPVPGFVVEALEPVPLRTEETEETDEMFVAPSSPTPVPTTPFNAKSTPSESPKRRDDKPVVLVWSTAAIASAAGAGLGLLALVVLLIVVLKSSSEEDTTLNDVSDIVPLEHKGANQDEHDLLKEMSEEIFEDQDMISEINTSKSTIDGKDSDQVADEGLAPVELIVPPTPLPEAGWLEPVLQATVRITSDPTGAEVIINGESHGKTPLSTTLAFSNYGIELVLDGYQTTSGSFEVDSDQISKNFTMHPSKDRGLVTISLDGREGQTLTIDGVEVGALPVTIELESGEHVFSVRAPGAGEFQVNREVKFSDGQMELKL